MGVDIPEGAMDQAKPMMDMIDAMGQQMFNEIIDENGDGAASIEEIEMVSNGFCLPVQIWGKSKPLIKSIILLSRYNLHYVSYVI